MWRIAANIVHNQSRTADKGWSSSLSVGRGANNSSPQKKKSLYHTGPGNLVDSLKGCRTMCDSGKGPVAGFCEHSNEASGFIKPGEFSNWLKDY